MQLSGVYPCLQPMSSNFAPTAGLPEQLLKKSGYCRDRSSVSCAVRHYVIVVLSVMNQLRHWSFASVLTVAFLIRHLTILNLKILPINFSIIYYFKTSIPEVKFSRFYKLNRLVCTWWQLRQLFPYLLSGKNQNQGYAGTGFQPISRSTLLCPPCFLSHQGNTGG